MARSTTLRAPSQLPVAMKATRLSKIPPRTSIYRDECPVTTPEMTRRFSTPLGSPILERLMQTRGIRQAAVDMRAMLDKGATVLPKGNTMTIAVLDSHTRQLCHPLVLRRTAQARPVTRTRTRPRSRPNAHTTPSNTACRNRRHSQT